MENASRALIMAASVLLGVMILSIGVYLFSVYGQYSANAYKQMDDAQIAQFNTQFLKYYGNTSRSYTDATTGREVIEEGPILCTAHDIMSLANLAQQSNKSNEFKDGEIYNQDPNVYYIQIALGNRNDMQHMETWNT